MQTELYFWKPLIERHKKELSIVEDYYNKTKSYFDNIDEEAEEYGNKLFDEYPGTENTDSASVAEWAQDESIEMYQSLLTMKSNHLLMTISLLYHTWEQQLIKFTINEMNHYSNMKKKVKNYREVQIIFSSHGIIITDTVSWSKIRELKLLTNTIKHGDGESAEKLRKIRPDFFLSKYFSITDTLKLNGAVLLEGYTLKVDESDLLEYVQSCMSFWDEMPERAYSDTDSILAELGK